MSLSGCIREFINGNPTRTVEHAFSWIMIVWGLSVLTGDYLVDGPSTPWGPMLSILPAWGWGVTAVLIGAARIVALILNGHWHPTPEIRLVGAVWGAMFWIALIYCYSLAIMAGAPDFPMRKALYVFVVFEFYACYRCGLDMGKRSLSIHYPVTSPRPA